MQQPVQANIRGNIQIPQFWPLKEGYSGGIPSQRAMDTEQFSIS